VGALWDMRNDAYCVCLYCWIVVDGFLDVNKIRFEINKYVSFVQKGSANIGGSGGIFIRKLQR
jgi:hypothetical protein